MGGLEFLVLLALFVVFILAFFPRAPFRTFLEQLRSKNADRRPFSAFAQFCGSLFSLSLAGVSIIMGLGLLYYTVSRFWS